MPPGREAEFEISGLDHLGVPVWSAALWPGDGPFTNGIGYGTTRGAARTSAHGEMFESVNAWRAFSTMPRTRGSYESLVSGRGSRGSRGVLDPREACLPAGSRYTPRTELEWVPARRYPDGEEVLVPVELAATRFADLGSSPAPGECLTTPITNGLGAGPTFAHALSHALLELVQRDGNSVSYRALDRGVAVDLAGIEDEQTLGLLRTLGEGGVDVTVKLAETDLGMANFYAVGEDRNPGGAVHPLTVTACGEAAHPDREIALRKCLAEFCAARARKPFNHGPLPPIHEISPPGYVERFRGQPLGSEEDRSLEATLDWLSRSYGELREIISDPVLAVRSRVPISEVPSIKMDEQSRDYRERLLETVVDRLWEAGLEVLYLDLSQEDGDARAVKALVPGLEVETMSYGRIGPRNLRRLLDRDSGLVLTGDPGGRPGARRILLPPDKESELGPAWLDYEAVERTVGPLYPLYREPGRHVAALAAEERGIY
jgi:ribosomal protein S12 methylthiotransferase accessory factor